MPDLVSIPFIAGQWSLPAVHAHVPETAFSVSIPFIAGQWSLLWRAWRAEEQARVSIPFIAGQWSLQACIAGPGPGAGPGFNPLHCGAVVASGRAGARRRRCGGFNPLHCGAVVASRRPRRGARRHREVSIPFIAGQWSLRSPHGGRRRARRSFNPLHCGAVVASARSSARTSPIHACFNPLHCGAVVASPSHNAPLVLRRPAAEKATSLRPRSLRALARLAQTRYPSLTRAVYQVLPRRRGAAPGKRPLPRNEGD